MSEHTCACCASGNESTPERTVNETTSERWLGEDDVGDAALPTDVANAMSEFYGAPVGTLDDFVAATRDAVGERALAVADLCHTDGETPHVARTDGETYRFRCFFDGVVLALLRSERVDVHTESPAGTAIEMTVTPESKIEVSPTDAVMSFGIAGDAADGVEGEPSIETVYGTVCPYVRAFPTREAYEAWARGSDGATVGLPLSSGLPIAAALAAGR